MPRRPAVPGPQELLLIAVVALFVLGPERLPEAARGAARALRRLRTYGVNATRDLRGLADLGDIEREVQELRRELGRTRTELRKALRDTVRPVEEAAAELRAPLDDPAAPPSPSVDAPAAPPAGRSAAADADAGDATAGDATEAGDTDTTDTDAGRA
jgi:sec-independent protein translocase protein TatB